MIKVVVKAPHPQSGARVGSLDLFDTAQQASLAISGTGVPAGES